MDKLEFRNFSDILFAMIPALCLIVYILSHIKRKRILVRLKMDSDARFTIARTLLSVLGISLMFAAMLGPQVLAGYTEVETQGLDIYIVMDTSNSMMTQDIKPDRLSMAKKIAGDIIDELKGDRIGIIPFSSDAYVQMPLTDDYQLAYMFLDVIDSNMAGGGGTNIEAAIKLAISSFDETGSADRVVIIISDGEEHHTGSINALERLQDGKLKVFTIGVGTAKGGMIPRYDSYDHTFIDYKRNAEYEYIISSLKPELLKKLAAASGGAYYQASVSGTETDSLIQDISSLKRQTYRKQSIANYTQIYQYFLGAGLILFLSSYFLPERRRRTV